MAQKRTSYLKTSEVATALGVHIQTVYNWLYSGRIAEPSRHPITHVRQWTMDDIEAIRAVMAARRREEDAA